MNKKNLPIKMIIQQEKDIAKNFGMGSNKIFKEITPEFISEISDKFISLANFYSEVFNENEKVPAVGKIILREDAIAKSHRPADLCKDLDIIGAGALEELYIKVTKSGVTKTIDRLKKTLTKGLAANVSTIEDIKPIYSSEKITTSLKERLQENNEIVFSKIKIKSFSFGNEYEDALIKNYITKKLLTLGYYSELKTYGNNLTFFKINDVRSKDIESIAKINGIRQVDLFHEYVSPVQSDESALSVFEEDSDIPVSDVTIGIIDSGISESSILNKYVVERKEYVPLQYQNRKHGTFVASCLQYSSKLDVMNETEKKYFKLIDIVAIPNFDKEYGATATLSQDEFYEIVEEVMDQYGGKIKIWNLSLGTANKVQDEAMSDLGIFCDYIQDKYGVQFVIACGNYGQLLNEPLRTWHPQELNGIDRVTAPADSARALVVGSVSLKESADSLSKIGEPSPFSRCGPGSNYMIKPDVVDYGGNLTMTRSYKNLGVPGLDLDGNIVEGIGTSYATPKITYKFAKIYDDLAEKDLLMTKAFLIHAARVNSKEVDIDTEDINYYGFGQPGYNSSDILQCSDNEITLVFKQSVIRGTHLEMLDFPFPQSLIKEDRYTGEIFMTLVYNPPVDANYGSQYCRTNFDVSFGTYRLGLDGKFVFNGQVPLEKTWSDWYEGSRVKHGFKWSPIKSYYRNLTNGKSDAADSWKIRINMHERSQYEEPRQDFILIITIKGAENDTVYNDVVLELQNKGYLAINLETKYQIREKLKPQK